MDRAKYRNAFFHIPRQTVGLIFGTIFGAILGFSLRAVNGRPYTSREIMYVRYIGDLHIQMLRAVSFPIMTSCLILAFGTIDSHFSKRIGAQFALYFLATKLEATLLSLTITVLFMSIFHHTEIDAIVSQDVFTSSPNTIVDTMLDLVRNAFPASWVGMAVRSYETVLTPQNLTQDRYQWNVNGSLKVDSHVNMLGPVIVSITIGFAAHATGDGGRPFLNLIKYINMVMFRFVSWILISTPICIVSLIAAQILSEELSCVAGRLWQYIVVHACCLLIQLFCVYTSIYILVVRKNPFTYARQYSEAILTAFLTNSSLNTLQTSIACLEERAGIDSDLVRLIIPIAHQINKDGVAMFLSSAPVFIAKMHNRDLSLENYATIFLLSLPGSVSAATIPFGSLVAVVMITEHIAVPSNYVGLIVAVEWILGRLRTVVNVVGDAVGLRIIETLNKKVLEVRRASSLVADD